MYAACLFCKVPLGRNEAIENFEVGGRLAYEVTGVIVGEVMTVEPRMGAITTQYQA